MDNIKVVSIFALGQAEDGKVYVNKPMDSIFSIDTDVEIIVSEGVNVKLLDTSNNKNVTVTGLKDSVVTYYILKSEGTNRTFNISGELSVTEISLGKTEEKLNINLVSENAAMDVKNLVVLTKESSKFCQYADHKIGQTFSNIRNVGVALEGANITFDTTGKIEKGMAKSKCSQLSRGIVMDDISAITAKPILLIDEFDCFANHGASIGKMSDEDLFYLMSRGLTKKEAFLLILQGIIRPFLDVLPIEELRNQITEEINNRIGE